MITADIRKTVKEIDNIISDFSNSRIAFLQKNLIIHAWLLAQVYLF